jgi:UDP-N-acetylmuramoylalanine--D-glutamate ligase
MDDFKKHFRGEKITVMGLGILGRGLGYTKFLAECGADLIVTDLKSREQLKTSIKALEKFKNIKFVLGKHSLEDFRNRDMVIKSAGVPLDSIYIKEARKNKIRVEMDVSLFIKTAPKITVVGVTGTRGKSMTTALIYEILSKNLNGRKVYLGGNVRGVATLPLLKKVKEGDVLVCELDSWQLQGFGDSKISPNIAVFTSFMPDHMNYYKNSMRKYFFDKANIFKYQNKKDTLIINKEVKKLIKDKIKAKIILADKKSVNGFEFIVPGEHQKQNLTYAVEVAKRFNIPVEKIKKTVREFSGLEGRLQYVKTIKGIKIYNDNNATTPEATIAGIKAFVDKPAGVRHLQNIILICGGADKKLLIKNLVSSINRHCKAILMLSGTGTDRLLAKHGLKIMNKKAKNLKEAIDLAVRISKSGDIILFSPAFASFGQFNNEYERNDLFLSIIKKLK